MQLCICDSQSIGFDCLGLAYGDSLVIQEWYVVSPFLVTNVIKQLIS